VEPKTIALYALISFHRLGVLSAQVQMTKSPVRLSQYAMQVRHTETVSTHHGLLPDLLPATAPLSKPGKFPAVRLV